PYRDEPFAPEFPQALFISEPVYNCVRCEILEPDGISFRSHRWQAEEPREFIASTDPWFRPTGLKVGPDGALYIPDMYRQFIEHPEWIPDDIKTRYDMRAGEDRGRIYRVRPRDVPLRPAPRLDRLDVPPLVAALDSPNGWQRDTVQRLLVTRAEPASIAPLRQLLTASTNAKTRLSALCTLEGVNGLASADLLRALQDPHPALREHAVRLSEPFLRARGGSDRPETRPASSPPGFEDLAPALLSRIDDEAIRVRYQLAFSLGEWDDPRAAQGLARIALRDAGHKDVLIAVASSSTLRPGEILASLLDAHSDLSTLE